jgi:hypothetical protein
MKKILIILTLVFSEVAMGQDRFPNGLKIGATVLDSVGVTYNGIPYRWDAIGSGSGGGTNNYVDGISFNDLNGVLTLTRLGLTDLTVDLDGRYVVTSDLITSINSELGNTDWQTNTNIYNSNGTLTSGRVISITGSGNLEIGDTATNGVLFEPSGITFTGDITAATPSFSKAINIFNDSNPLEIASTVGIQLDLGSAPTTGQFLRSSDTSGTLEWVDAPSGGSNQTLSISNDSLSISGGNTVVLPSASNTILTTSLTTDRTLAVSDINDFNIFTIDAVGLTLTIPQTTLATGEIKFITFLAPNEASFTVTGDTGVTVPSPATFSGLRVVTLYSTTEDVWLLYNSEEDAGGGISGVETQDEGIQVDADATTLNFVGAGVSATDAGNGVTTVTISGGGGGGFNQTTFNGQDVHFIKHPDNSASTFETGDFITNYVESDTLVQLAQFRGGAQSYANLDVVESLIISSRFDIAVPVTGVSVLPASATLDIGQTQQLTETVAPANADDPSVTWSSDTPAVATVSSSGLVTAVSAGSATITVETTDGGFKDTSDITVNSAGTQLLSGDASSLVNEADSRGTWSNDFYNSTETVDTNGSTYAQETIGTTSFTNSDLTLSGLTIGDTIVIEFDAKCNTQNEQNVTLTDTSDNSSFWTNGSQPTTWTSYSRTVTVTATSFVFRVTGSAGGGQNGDIILIDNLSIIQQ